ncbi:N-hydroxycinnamoyl/benzoyltransferase 6 [Heracleum sosnowskyi]|uniref:N-hydroxycinnamoyl/benzoyltransferase 6 n=1 Tax=Heracleum sosnowskyi TaxID=360622 RepID=A0AAD8M9T1_9APIA|nr:N-hydroxycinnamoyl/benzoyltransferase 6 [Heracleum sosnowskyi]
MNSEITVQQISECFVKPSHLPQDSKQVIHLATWDLAMLSFHYIQKGLLFENPDGRLARKQEDSHSFVVFIDCVNSPGARFVHSSVDATISDILSPPYVPIIVQSFFDHHKAVNYDGLNMSLLTVQVTELIDGIFVGCSVNHSVADGTSYWNFFNTLSQVFRGSPVTTPIHERWFPDGYGPVLSLPFTRDDQFISRYDTPILKERIFHFSVSALARIKAKANAHCKDKAIRISSLQALSATIWRSVTRVRGLTQDQITSCCMPANNRSRLDPTVSKIYFGNCIQILRTFTTASKLLANDLQWAALQLHKTIIEHNDKSVRKSVATWLQTPITYQIGQLVDSGTIVLSSSPHFNMYGNDFGFGKPVKILSGYANKFDGEVTLYQGCEGQGSIDTGICLNSDIMSALECDEEFLDALNTSS